MGEFVASARGEGEIARISQELELLADFRADVVVVGMKLGEVALKSVHLLQREFGLPQTLHAGHDIDEPAALFKVASRQKRGVAVLLAYFLRGSHLTVADVENAPAGGYGLGQDAASHPSRARCRGFQRWTFLDDFRGEVMRGRDKQVSHHVLGIVLQEEKRRRRIGGDALNHRPVRAIRYGTRNAVLPALQLKIQPAFGTEEIRHRSVRLVMPQPPPA